MVLGGLAEMSVAILGGATEPKSSRLLSLPAESVPCKAIVSRR